MTMNEDSLKHGAFGWNELMTTDVEAAKEFYASLFGWETEEAPMEGMKYTVVKVDGDPVGGITNPPPDCEAMTPCWGVYVTVDDVDATAGQVEGLGGKLLHPPMDIPGVGRFCVLQDPQGGTICAITYVKE
jgi:predicted enzyme related to lactoylglutathione lyase